MVTTVLVGICRDLLRRTAGHHTVSCDGAGVSIRNADANDVRRGRGRRCFSGGESRTWRTRFRACKHAGGLCAGDRSGSGCCLHVDIYRLWRDVLSHDWGTSGVLAQATSYSTVLFSGALLVWLSNTLGAVLSGAGNMRVPLMASAMTAILQIGLDGVLGLGLGLGPIQSYVLAPTLGPAQRNVGAVAHLMVDANIRVPSPPPGGF